KVLDEVKTILFLQFPKFNFSKVNNVFRDIVKLFRGEYPGYRRCNTEYHDLQHTTDSLLAITRLIHGAVIAGEKLSENNIEFGLITTLMHDTGYIQSVKDDAGTGAKYTLVHIKRSTEFMDMYFEKNKFSRIDFKNCSDMLNCTGLNTMINEIQFASPEIALLGKMLGAADLLGQMADRAYLEKLLFLFYEFREGNIAGYQSEIELLKKTLNFYEITKKRLLKELDGVTKYLPFHFNARWKINKDLYEEATLRNINYLKHILENHQEDHRNLLRRGGIVDRLEKKGL
ncbi:MAG: hypothetical protein ABIA63_09195, partial [bacterium]